MISLNTGAKEKIRCRAVYRVAETGADLQLELRCASDSYKFELQSAVSHSDGAISGTWSEVSARRGRDHLRNLQGQSDQSAGQQPDLLGDAGGEHPQQPAIDLDPVPR